jgi:hypothetical protein
MTEKPLSSEEIMKAKSHGIFLLRVPGALMLFAVLIPGVLGSDSLPAAFYNFPPKQQVLAFLVETIDWYRLLSVEQQIATEPTDVLFLEDNRPIGVQVVRFSFDFARAAVAFEARTSVPADPKGERIPASSGSDFQHLAVMESKSSAEAQQAATDLKLIKQKRPTASRADRKKLDVEIDDTQSRLTLLQAISTSLQNLLDYTQETNSGRTETTDLEAFVDSLERTVPEASSSATSPPVLVPAQSVSPTGVLKRAPSGILARISEVSMLAGRGRTLNEAIALTDKLVQSSLHLQRPLDKPLNEAFRNSDLLAGTTASDDLAALQQQEAHIKAFTAQTAVVSPAIAALAKQRLLLALYKSHLVSWRASIASQYKNAWKNLLIRLAILAVVIAILIGAGEASRRVTSRHIHDSNSRRMILIAQRVLFWLILVLIVLFAFAFNLSSLATFLGLVSAGIAVALQNVILAVVGYFLLIGKLRMRIGDRVQISGVSGEVIDIGLMQFQIQELDTSGEQPTGQVVSFSNSFVFVSPATGLFKGMPGSAKNPGEISVRMTDDHRLPVVS